jgi:hypothetical protein
MAHRKINSGVNKDHHKPYVYSYSKESVFPVVKDEELLEEYRRSYNECKYPPDKRFFNSAIRSLENKLYGKPQTPKRHPKGGSGKNSGKKKLKRVPVTQEMIDKTKAVFERFPNTVTATKGVQTVKSYYKQVIDKKVKSVIITYQKELDKRYEEVKHLPVINPIKIKVSKEVYDKCHKLNKLEEANLTLDHKIGIRPQTISRIKRGERKKITPEDAQKILAYE